MEDAKLLADAVNLDDYGVIGFSLQAIQLARQGDGIAQLIDGLEKREQYGYWEAASKTASTTKSSARSPSNARTSPPRRGSAQQRTHRRRPGCVNRTA